MAISRGFSAFNHLIASNQMFNEVVVVAKTYSNSYGNLRSIEFMSIFQVVI